MIAALREGTTSIGMRWLRRCPMLVMPESISIESFTPDNETIARAASIWRPLAATQDDIAIDGLAFLCPWRAQWKRTCQTERTLQS